MHYQIYLPGKRIGDGLHLEEAGLGHLRGTEEYFPTHSGPDGKGGMIVAFRNGDPAGPFGFEPDEQEWIENVERRTSNVQRPTSKLKFKVQSSKFEVRIGLVSGKTRHRLRWNCKNRPAFLGWKLFFATDNAGSSRLLNCCLKM